MSSSSESLSSHSSESSESERSARDRGPRSASSSSQLSKNAVELRSSIALLGEVVASKKDAHPELKDLAATYERFRGNEKEEPALAAANMLSKAATAICTLCQSQALDVQTSKMRKAARTACNVGERLLGHVGDTVDQMQHASRECEKALRMLQSVYNSNHAAIVEVTEAQEWSKIAERGTS